MRNFFIFFSTGCCSGYLPIAPGTWGTVVGLALYWAIHGLEPPVYAATTIAFMVFAIWVSEGARKLFGGEDPPKIVIDEIAGFLVTMAFHRPALAVAVGGFLLFRLFDIVKPWPARWIERRFPDGRGIVLDDVLAGVYSNAALWFFELVVPTLGIRF